MPLQKLEGNTHLVDIDDKTNSKIINSLSIAFGKTSQVTDKLDQVNGVQATLETRDQHYAEGYTVPQFEHESHDNEGASFRVHMDDAKLARNIKGIFRDTLPAREVSQIRTWPEFFVDMFEAACNNLGIITERAQVKKMIVENPAFSTIHAKVHATLSERSKMAMNIPQVEGFSEENVTAAIAVKKKKEAPAKASPSTAITTQMDPTTGKPRPVMKPFAEMQAEASAATATPTVPAATRAGDGPREALSHIGASQAAPSIQGNSGTGPRRRPVPKPAAGRG